RRRSPHALSECSWLSLGATPTVSATPGLPGSSWGCVDSDQRVGVQRNEKPNLHRHGPPMRVAQSGHCKVVARQLDGSSSQARNSVSHALAATNRTPMDPETGAGQASARCAAMKASILAATRAGKGAVRREVRLACACTHSKSEESTPRVSFAMNIRQCISFELRA